MKVDNSSIYDASRSEKSIFERLGVSSKEEAIAKVKSQRDTYEFKGMEKWNGCEQYNDLRKQLVKSDNAGLHISSDARTDMRLTLEDYYAGKLSDEELEESFLSYCAQLGACNKAQILDVYENFINMSRYASTNTCARAASELDQKYGGSRRDSVYYSADIYYAFEKVKEIARNASDKIAGELNLGEMDFEEREKNTIFNLDGDFSFNGHWAWTAQNLMNRCTMIDSDMVPPEGFEFYYKERSTPDSEEGVMILGINGARKEITVPFRMPRAGITEYIQKFNAAELFQYKEGDTAKYEDYGRFLRNFDIYTRYYFARHLDNSSL